MNRPCRCFACLLTMGALAEIAPGLAYSRDQIVRRRHLEGRRKLNERRLLLAAERLVAHRELQLIRAGNGHGSKYIAARQRKLVAAQRQLDRLRAEAA